MCTQKSTRGKDAVWGEFVKDGDRREGHLPEGILPVE